MKRLAWFSPLPISQSAGSKESIGAYWSALLLPLLRQQFEIEVFYDGFGRYQNFETHHFLSAIKRHHEAPFDIVLYQFEDKKCSDFIRIHLGVLPGIVVFHDTLLLTDGPEPILNSPWSEIVTLYRDDTAAWPPREAEYTRERAFAIREASLAASAIFSCARMRSDYVRSMDRHVVIGSGQTHFIPHPVASFASPNAPRGNAHVIAMCESPQIESRPHKIFQALASVRQSGTDLKVQWLVAPGELSQAEALVEQFSISCEVFTGRSPERWAEIVSGATIAFHTRFSVYGQLGPYLPISLSRAVPCIVTDFGGIDFIPDAIVFKIEPGQFEATQIEASVRAILQHPEASLGRRAAEYAREEFPVAKIAAELCAVLHAETPHLREMLSRWKALGLRARDVAVKDALLRPKDSIDEIFVANEKEIFAELQWP